MKADMNVFAWFLIVVGLVGVVSCTSCIQSDLSNKRSINCYNQTKDVRCWELK